MIIEQQYKLVDDDGNYVEEIVLSRSRFSRMAIKRMPEKRKVLVRAEEGSNTYQFEFDVAEVVLQGISPRGRKRRDIDDDVQDALLAAGFSVTDFGEGVIHVE